ncbi:DUF255 domain-containing protein [Thioalkalivibrio sp. AKL8]|uniref:DUF255 domain-containing protein n=1 Tax=Thioalkalivibrio sp. AKL8 TaxID=1158156 RepID=UPI000477E8B2|nr:DUF255 domain-containing protein [Thioalkalivibrio sp. AKL8]
MTKPLHIKSPPATHRIQWSAARGFVAGLVLLLLALPAAAEDYPADSAIAWQDWDSQLFEESEARERPIFFYFHGQWCTWCRDFQDESLENPDVVDTIDQHYIPVLVDLDERADLFRRYGGRGLPFVVIVNHEDEMLTRFTGHVNARDLQSILVAQRDMFSVTGREITPDDAAIDDLDAFMEMLDEVYDARADRLSGSATFGTLSKRPQPWTYRFLLTAEAWRDRMPGLLDQIAEDLYDEVEGGFFFFHDPDQRDPVLALETSKRLDQNAAFLWLFSNAYETLGDEHHAEIARGIRDYLRNQLWDERQLRFGNSQYADRDYYQLDPETRTQTDPPRVDRNTYADTSGQAIAALANMARVMEDRETLEWAREALTALDRYLQTEQGYLHGISATGRPAMGGYLPSQIWPEIARQELARATEALDGERPEMPDPLAALDRLEPFFNKELGAHAERIGTDLEPWSETRTQAALAWWLYHLPDAAIEESHIDRDMVRERLRIEPGADPDDVALGFDALRRGF